MAAVLLAGWYFLGDNVQAQLPDTSQAAAEFTSSLERPTSDFTAVGYLVAIIIISVAVIHTAAVAMSKKKK